MVHRDRIRSLPEGAKPPDWLDKDDPYADIDISRLPDWWRDAVVEFRAHDLPPYRPPRFADDVLVPSLLIRIETVHDIEIQLMGINVDHGDAWGIRIDGDIIATVDRDRTSDGYTQYEITSEEFTDVVRAQVETAPDESVLADRI